MSELKQLETGLSVVDATPNDPPPPDSPSTIVQAEPLDVDQKHRFLNDNVRRLILGCGIVVGMFLISLNTTVVAPAINIIASDLSSVESQTWIATAYLLGFNSSQPLSGKLSDIFGRKPVLLFGLIFFYFGSLLNALSPNINALLAGRTIQGLGGGCVMSMAIVIIADLAPVWLRPRFQAGFSVVYGLSSVIGPLLGGAFVDNLTWRWDFWFNVIVGAYPIGSVVFLLKEPVDIGKSSFVGRLKRIDWFGIVFSVACICCILLALNWGNIYGWSSSYCIGTLVAAGVSFIVLIGIEGWWADEPIFPPEIILDPAIFLFYLQLSCVAFGFIGCLYYGPVLYQSVFGATSTESGIRLVPYMGTLIVVSVGSALYLPRFPYPKLYILAGAISNMIGYGLFYTVNEHSNWAQQACYLMFCGFALGITQQNTVLGVQAVCPEKYMAVATGLSQFFFMLLCSIGVAIFQTLFEIFLSSQLKLLDPEVLATAASYGATQTYRNIKDLPLDVQRPIIHAYMKALNSVFIAPMVAGAIGFVAVLFLKNVRYGSPAQAEDNNSQDSKAQEAGTNP